MSPAAMRQRPSEPRRENADADLDEIARRAGRVPVPGAEPDLHRPLRLREEDWGQPRAERYSARPVDEPDCGPALKTKREKDVYFRMETLPSDRWIETPNEGSGVHVCVRSRLSGKVARYWFPRDSALVKLMRWEYKRERLAEQSASRCTCRVVEGRCRLCQESYANGPVWPEEGEPADEAPAHLYE